MLRTRCQIAGRDTVTIAAGIVASLAPQLELQTHAHNFAIRSENAVHAN